MTPNRFRAGLCAAALLVFGPAAAFAGDLAPVRLNQIGLTADGVKRAVAPNRAKTPVPWTLRDGAGAEVAKGMTVVFGADAASGEFVHEIDFSSVDRRGDGFVLEVGGAKSRPFAIGAPAYDRLKRDALNFFYQNRSGIEIKAEYAGGAQWARPAGHPQDRQVSCFAGKDEAGRTWPGCDYTLDLSGGWYDAGDHGKYVVNGGISVWTLLNLYERAAHGGRSQHFPDGSAKLPEAGNGVDDLLDEVRWQLDFQMRMQAPDGAKIKVPVGAIKDGDPLEFVEIDATGMVHHKMASVEWTGIPQYPHTDPKARTVYAPSTAATLNLAANAAQCARIWKSVDPAFSQRCLRAARRAFAAASRHPNIFPGNFAGSGGYGDGDLADEFYWAAAELYLAVDGEEKGALLQKLKQMPLYPNAGGGAGDFSWNAMQSLGTISLAVVPGLADEDRAAARAALIRAADAFLADTSKVGYRIPYAPERTPWGSNSTLLNRAIILALAHDFTGEAKYRNGVIDAMDYVLGRNPLDQSYVTGYGARPMQNPHHRVWAKQADPKTPSPPPGIVSGGPNDSAMYDPVAQEMKGKCTSQTCWVDDYRAYTLNEITINWNAPLVWVAAWLDEHSN